jgi:hypothetical protein
MPKDKNRRQFPRSPSDQVSTPHGLQKLWSLVTLAIFGQRNRTWGGMRRKIYRGPKITTGGRRYEDGNTYTHARY